MHVLAVSIARALKFGILDLDDDQWTIEVILGEVSDEIGHLLNIGIESAVTHLQNIAVLLDKKDRFPVIIKTVVEEMNSIFQA